MKKLILLALSLVMVTFIAEATTITVNVADFSFAPNNFSCSIGDTVKFAWQNGTHTTTSTSVPSGANSWNANISSASQIFDYVVKVAGTYNYQCNFHVSLGMIGNFTAAAVSGISSVESENAILQVANPASQSIHVSLTLPEPKNVSIGLYDLTGKFLDPLMDAPVAGGTQHLSIPLNENIASGLYVLKVQIGDLVLNRKLVIRN